MGLLTGETPRDTAIAWLLVAGQFVLLALIVLLPGGDAWSVPVWLDRLALVLELIGLVALVAGVVNLGRSLTPLPTPIEHGVLRVNGLYRWVRHPIYSGTNALAIGVTIRSASWGVAAATLGLIVWFMAKARFEEHHLRRRYPEYAAYAAKTPRFVPFWPFG